MLIWYTEENGGIIAQELWIINDFPFLFILSNYGQSSWKLRLYSLIIRKQFAKIYYLNMRFSTHGDDDMVYYLMGEIYCG